MTRVSSAHDQAGKRGASPRTPPVPVDSGRRRRAAPPEKRAAAGSALISEDVPTVVPPEESAQAAGLRYVSNDRPGIRRRRSGKGFVYLTPAGARVRDEETLARIRSLVIPPAWTDVWICSSANGHLQATGQDARG